MLKYLLPFLILLTACSHNEPDIVDLPQGLPEISQNNDWYITEILAHLGIDEITFKEGYIPIKNSFTQIHSSCSGKWFVEYRQCLISWFNSEWEKQIFPEQIMKKIPLLIHSIENEIRFVSYYLTLDQASMPDNLPYGTWSHEERLDCNILSWTGVNHMNYMGEPTTTVVLLSYFYDFSRLEEIFPWWKNHKDLYKNNKTKVESYHKGNPCSYWTFGPDMGNILYFMEKWNFVYLFIKESDGAWSGEFDYSIFVHEKWTQKFWQVANFYAWSGIIPYYAQFYPWKDVSSKKVRYSILEKYQNEIFLYRADFWNQSTHITTTIIDLLEKSLQ